MSERMTNLELAYRYMEIFYSGKDLGRLFDLFSDNLMFNGPLFQFESAKEYIDSLKSSPPKGMSYRILQAYENKTHVCLVYQFTKEDVSILMAQQFKINGDKISEIHLIFDSKGLT